MTHATLLCEYNVRGQSHTHANFAELCFSALWLPPVIPCKVDKNTMWLAISDDLFLAKMKGT